MKRSTALMACAFALAATLSTTAAPLVTVEPFEPALSECFDPSDKFRQPPLLVAPKIAFPSEARRGPEPQVIVLVQIDEGGSPKRLSILTSSGEIYSRAALEGLKHARWNMESKTGRKSVWFYFPVAFTLR